MLRYHVVITGNHDVSPAAAWRRDVAFSLLDL